MSQNSHLSDRKAPFDGKKRNLFAGLTTPVKLNIAFGVVIALGLGQFFFVFQAVRQSAAASGKRIRQANLAVDLASQASQLNLSMGYFTLAYGASLDPKMKEAKLSSDEAYGKKMDEAREVAQGIGDPAKVVADIESVVATDEKCDDLENQAIELYAKKKNKEATQLLMTKWAPLRADLMDTFKQINSKLLDHVKAEEVAGAKAEQAVFQRGVAIQLLIALIAGIVSWRTASAIKRQLDGMVERIGNIICDDVVCLSDALNTMAKGDLTPRLDCKSKGIETRAFEEMIQLSEMFDRMAKATATASESFNVAASGLSGVVGSIRTRADELAEASASLLTTSEENAKASSEVASGSETLAFEMSKSREASASLSAAIHAVEESIASQMTATSEADQHISEAGTSIGESMTAAKQMASSVDEARKAVDVTAAAIDKIAAQAKLSAERVGELDEKGQKVGNIVVAITTISEQTNLLALNAAIEAARAGEHGRGFAVVAEEVRKLAEQTRAASIEIADLITELRGNVTEVVSVIESTNVSVEAGVQSTVETLGSLKTIQGQSTNLSAALTQLQAASNELGNIMSTLRTSSATCVESAEEMNASVQGVVESVKVGGAVSEQGAAAAEELYASTQETGRAAQALSDLAEDMRKSVEMFVVSPASAGQESGLSRAA